MNVNFFPFSNSLQILGRRQSLANIMCNQQSVTQSSKKIYLLEIQCMIQEFIQLQQEKEIK